MLRQLEPGEFVQGTIFTCGLSDSYPDDDVHGMLITARCDTAQGKTSVYNYIPLVPVESWLLKDGLEIIAKRSLANELAGIKSALKDAGMTHTILQFVDQEAMYRELNSVNTKQGKGVTARYQNCSAKANEDRSIVQRSDRTLSEALTYLRSRDPLYKSVIKELMTNAIADFHYIDQIDFDQKSRGYVALLREIRFISASLGSKIAVGLDREDFLDLSSVYSPELNHIRFSETSEFSMPLACISSPYIELIMQRFSNLFSRIGVPDISSDKIVQAHSWVSALLGEIE